MKYKSRTQPRPKSRTQPRPKSRTQPRTQPRTRSRTQSRTQPRTKSRTQPRTKSRTQSLRVKTEQQSSIPCPTAMNDKGNDGCVVFCNSCGDFVKEKYVTKIIYAKTKPINRRMHRKLHELNELYGFRFNIYEGINNKFCRRTTFNNPDVIECLTKHNRDEKDTQFVFQKLLKSFGIPGRWTRAQYNYFQESIKILNANGINHGDLHAHNVMQDDKKNPIIIDWDRASYSPNKIATNRYLDFDNIIDEPEVVTKFDDPFIIDD